MFLGNDAALMGGAVTAVVRDGGSLWYNPAGLGGAARDSIDVTASVYSLRLYRAPRFIRSVQGASTDLSVNEFLTVPTQISYLRRLNDSVSLGLGYFAPRASNFIVRERLHATVDNTVSDWSVNGLASYSEYVFGGAVGVELTPDFRIGAGASLRWDSVTQSVDVFGATATDATTDRLVQAGSLRTESDFGIEPTLGIQWQIDQLTLGLNVRGPRFSLLGAGEIAQSTSVATLVSGPLLAADATPVEIERHPFALVRWGRYYAGAAYRFDRTLVSIEGDVQPGLVKPDEGVDRQFAWNARVGATQELSDAVAVGCGLFTDRVADRNREGTLVTDGGNFYGASAGLRFRSEHRLAAGEPADSLVFKSVFALKYARAKAKTESLIVDPSQDIDGSFALDKSDLVVHEVGLYVGSGIDF